MRCKIGPNQAEFCDIFTLGRPPNPNPRAMAEGVGFEPTVGCPTLDFESSALNRTQPPFLKADQNFERRTSNIERRMQTSSGISVHCSAFNVCLSRSDILD